MMVSRAQSNQDQDPWSWTVEDVVATLCNANGFMKKEDPMSQHQPFNLAPLLRAHQVCGSILLTKIDDLCLRSEFGMNSIGERGFVEIVVTQLRDQSLKYREHLQAKFNTTTPIANHGSPSRFNPPSIYASPFHGVPNQYNTSFMTPSAVSSTNRLLLERLSSPDRTRRSHSASHEGATLEVSITEQGSEIRNPTAQTPPQKLELEVAQSTPLNILQGPDHQADSNVRDDQMEASHDSTVSHSNYLENPMTPTHRKMPETHTQVESGLRRGETYIFDDSGRKRRRLQLNPLNLQSDSGTSKITVGGDVSLPDQPTSVGTITRQSSHDHALVSINEQLSSDGILGTADTDQAIALNDRIEPSAEVCNQEIQEPGKLIVDSQGRKRMRPFFVAPLNTIESNQPDIPLDMADELDDQSMSSPVVSMLDKPNTTLDSRRSRTKRSMHQMYLGPDRLPVDEVFYGDTPMDQEVQFGCHKEEPLQFSFQSNVRTCSGKGIYVYNRIKHFLFDPRIEMFHRKGHIFTSIVPYPDRIAKKHQRLSLTLLKKSDSSIKAYRIDRAKWSKLKGQDHYPDGLSQHPDKQRQFVGDAENDSLLHQIDENEAIDWDILKKWEYQDSASDVLPLYGDSGSENELDLDTWREMEEERGALDRPLAPTRRNKMTLEEVDKAIDDATTQMIEEWTRNKRPRLEQTAWRLWTKSRRDETKRDQINYLSQAIDKLNTRLAKIRKELTEEIWSSAVQVKKQCQCMHASIFDRENYLWKIRILEMKSRPKKPISSNEKQKSKALGSPPVPLEDGEEDLTTDDAASLTSDEHGLNDFIDDGDIDEPLLFDERLNDANAAAEDNETTDDETIDEADPNTALRVTSPVDIEDDSIEESKPETTRHLRPSSSNSFDMRDQPLQSSPLSELSLSPSLIPETELPSAQNHGPNFVRDPDFIDLTQQSSSPTPKTPEIKHEQYMIRTPPLFQSDEDPFARDRKANVEFKVPNIPLDIIDLDTCSDSPKESDPVPRPKKLPELWERKKIRKLDTNYLQERGDRKRLLIWLLENMSRETLKEMIELLAVQDCGPLRKIIWDCMNRMKSHSRRLRGCDEADSLGFMRLTNLYVTWSRCMLPDEADGLLVGNIDMAREDKDGFEPFYSFLKENLKHYEKPQSSLRGTRRTKKQKEEKAGDSSDESLHTTGSSSRKRRKIQIPESQEALVIRSNALERVRDTKIRSIQMEARLRNMGVASQDISTMAINMGASAGQDLIPLNPKIGARIQPHQSEGVRFMWGEIVNKQGCLLAHTMGLGKTMQVITLLVTIAEASKSSNENVRTQVPEDLRESKTLVLCPPPLIDNWYDEFLMWTPKPLSNNVGELRKVTSNIRLPDRLYEIQEWSDNGGVLLIGYYTFRDLISNKTRKSTGEPPLSDKQHEKILDQLLQRPNIVVADEAHAMKARASEIAQATKRFRTQSRIALTGSPLANNLEEYFAVIDWVSPKYLGDLIEFRSRYVEPITNGLFRDSLAYEKRKGLKMLEVLTRQLQPKVHRADISVLKGRLPGKTEFVIRVPLTDLQEQAYKIYVTYILASTKSNEPAGQLFLVWLAVLRLLCNHPKCFIDKLNGNQKKAKKQSARPSASKRALALNGEDFEATADELMNVSVSELGLPEEMLIEQKKLFETFTENINSIQLAHKMKLLMKILKFSEEAGDKVLVFSHSLSTLDYIEQLLKHSKRKYDRLDGSTKMSIRSDLTKEFNAGDSKVCLISTRAGGQGFNLFGANRVVIVDDNFNPMHEEQAIGRAYRLGQQKHVYVYRLTVGGSFEEALQNQSLFKLQLATRVVDKKNPMRNALKGVRQYIFPPRSVEQQDITQFWGKDELVLDRILASQEELSIIRSITLSETLHQEVFEELTADEKREVKEMEEDEILRRTDPGAYRSRLQQREREKLEQQKQIFMTLRGEEAEASRRTDASNFLQPHLEHEASSTGLMPVLASRASFSAGGSALANDLHYLTFPRTEGSKQPNVLPTDDPQAAHLELTNKNTSSNPHQVFQDLAVSHSSAQQAAYMELANKNASLNPRQVFQGLAMSHPAAQPPPLNISSPSNTHQVFQDLAISHPAAQLLPLNISNQSEVSAPDPLTPMEPDDLQDRPMFLDGEASNDRPLHLSPSILDATRSGSDIPSEIRSLVPKKVRNSLRHNLESQLSTRLPILSEAGLFSSSRGEEVCRKLAKLLERMAAKQAKDEADYKKLIGTHISTCLKNDKHLGDALKATERKRMSSSTTSRTLSQTDLAQISESSDKLRHIKGGQSVTVGSPSSVRSAQNLSEKSPLGIESTVGEEKNGNERKGIRNRSMGSLSVHSDQDVGHSLSRKPNHQQFTSQFPVFQDMLDREMTRTSIER